MKALLCGFIFCALVNFSFSQENNAFIIIKRLEIDSLNGTKRLEITKIQNDKKIEEIYENDEVDKKLQELKDADFTIISNNLPDKKREEVAFDFNFSELFKDIKLNVDENNHNAIIITNSTDTIFHSDSVNAAISRMIHSIEKAFNDMDVDIIINNTQKITTSSSSSDDYFNVSITPASIDNFVNINFFIPQDGNTQVRVINKKNEEIYYEEITQRGHYSRMIPILKKREKYIFTITQNNHQERKEFSLNY